MNVISPSEDYEEGLRLLRESTGNSTAEYREGQWEAIEHILNKRGPLLVVQKTGWGKSRSEMGASGAVVAAVGPGFGPWGTAGGETRIGIRRAITKVKETAPQKEMQNRFQQARNLDGAFEVEKWGGMEEPILLLDDMVDSTWTFTVLCALLRAAGSGPVFPVALALSRGSEET